MQSAENVQLWSVIGKLQSEISDYKSRFKKLEAEVLSLKPTADESTARVIRTGLSGGAASKRGRPKRSIRLFSKCYVVDLTGNTTLIYKIPRENLFSLALSKRPSAQKVFNKTKELLSSLRGLKFSFQVMAHNQLGLVLKS